MEPSFIELLCWGFIWIPKCQFLSSSLSWHQQNYLINSHSQGKLPFSQQIQQLPWGLRKLDSLTLNHWIFEGVAILYITFKLSQWGKSWHRETDFFFKRLQIAGRELHLMGKITIWWSNPCYVHCPQMRSDHARQAVCHVVNSGGRFTGTQHGAGAVTPTRWGSSVPTSPV